MPIMNFLSAFVLGLPYLSLASTQLSGSVGPTTSYATKARTKTWNVLNYGVVANGTTDLGRALTSAWAACKTGGLLDGTIVRTGTAGGNTISIQDATNFEFFSGNSKGSMQSYGYEFISKSTFGPRFIRFTDVTDFSMHGFALVDLASYYTVFDTCANGEIYNLIMRGIDIGETDAIDIWSDNIWVHDIEITNGDHCITIKSPSNNILVESIHCNISGGCSIGSLGLDTAISNVYYRNIYANQADAAYLKTNGGTGTVSNLRYESVIFKGGAYVLCLSEAWGDSDGGVGVQINIVSFVDWYGTNIANSRPTIRLQCSDAEPCTDTTVSNVNLWTESGSSVFRECESAFGGGACLHNGSARSYAISSTTIKTAPSYSTSSMVNNLATAFPSTVSFSIPAVPTTFFPGLQPSSALLSLSGAGGGTASTTSLSKTTTTTSKTSTTLSTSKTSTMSTATSTGCVSTDYGQCGGSGWTGCTISVAGTTCTYSNEWYSRSL